jgi:hypothetical protein
MPCCVARPVPGIQQRLTRASQAFKSRRAPSPLEQVSVRLWDDHAACTNFIKWCSRPHPHPPPRLCSRPFLSIHTLQPVWTRVREEGPGGTSFLESAHNQCVSCGRCVMMLRASGPVDPSKPCVQALAAAVALVLLLSPVSEAEGSECVELASKVRERAH